MSVHESGEMYLEAILVLGKRSGFVRSVKESRISGIADTDTDRTQRHRTHPFQPERRHHDGNS